MKQRKTHIEDLAIIIQHPTSWKKFKKRLERKIQGTDNVTTIDILKALGDLNLQNFDSGRDSFFASDAEEAIERATGWRPEFVEGKGKLITVLNSIIGKRLPGKKLIERNGDIYRLNIFTAKGPAGSKQVLFYSKPNVHRFRRYVGYRMKELPAPTKETQLGLAVPKDEKELRACFDTLTDFEVDIVPREDADFLADVFEKDDLKVVVEGPPMVGKSVFAYLVGRKWLEKGKKVGVVTGRLGNEKPLILDGDMLLIVDVGKIDPVFDWEAYSALKDVKKVLMVRMYGEPRSAPSVREELDNYPLDEFLREARVPAMGLWIRCTIRKMAGIKKVVDVFEKSFGLRLDDEVKNKICWICGGEFDEHTVVGLVKAMFVGMKDLSRKGLLGEVVTVQDFKKIGARELKNYRASDKILRHIYSWLDDNLKKLLITFAFLNTFDRKMSPTSFDMDSVGIAFEAYHGEKLSETTIEKALDLGIIYREYSYYSLWHPYQVEVVEPMMNIGSKKIPLIRGLLEYSKNFEYGPDFYDTGALLAEMYAEDTFPQFKAEMFNAIMKSLDGTVIIDQFDEAKSGLSEYDIRHPSPSERYLSDKASLEPYDSNLPIEELRKIEPEIYRHDKTLLVSKVKDLTYDIITGLEGPLVMTLRGTEDSTIDESEAFFRVIFKTCNLVVWWAWFP